MTPFPQAPPPPPAPPGSQRGRSVALGTLIGFQILYVVFVPVWLFFAGMSVMWFDAPGSTSNGGLLALFFANLAYPVVAIGAAAGAWVLFAFRKYLAAVLCNLAPLIWVLAIGGVLLYANLQ